jgi:D-xylose 1-dehydrogenase
VAEQSFATYPSLQDRPVLITGGATGIGKAFVEAFAAQGAKVAFLDIDIAAASKLLDALEQSGVRHAPRFLLCNVTDTAALQTAVGEAVELLGGLSVLINNVADDTRHTLVDLTPEAWDACIAVNLKHQLFASQAAYPAIAKAGGGSIICVGSIAWLNNTTGMIGYTTSKAAIHGLVRTLARQLGPKRIRVNALLPGWTMTERQLEKWIDADARRDIERGQCLPDFVEPGDVARAALFLAADDSRMCTRQTFIVDGGWV